MLLICITSLSKAAQAPSDVEIYKLIEKLRYQEKIDWGDYVISEHLSDIAREKLHQKVRSEIDSKFRKEYNLKVLEKKQEEDICAVVLSTTDDRNPIFVEITGLTFCLVQGQWKLTPLMGRFDYSGFKLYQSDAESSQKLLEGWVFDRKMFHKSQIQKSLKKQLKQKIAAYTNKDVFLKNEAASVVLFFMEMCKQSNLYGISAALGLDVDVLSDDDVHVLYSVLDGLNGGWQTGEWNRLMNQPYAAVLMKPFDDELVSLAVFYPELEPQYQIIEFEVKKKGGRWCVVLPESMSLNENGEFPDSAFRGWELKRENRDRLDKVPELIIKSLKPQYLSSPAQLALRLTECLSEGDFVGWCLCARYNELEGKEEYRLKLESIAAEWTALKKKSVMSFQVVSLQESENVSVAKVMSMSKKRPNDYFIRNLLMVNDEGHWSLAVKDDFAGDGNKELSVERDKLLEALEKEGDLKVFSLLLGDCKVLPSENLEDCSSLDDDAIRASYMSYQTFLHDEKFEDALKQVVAIKGHELQLLNAVGADLRGRLDKDSNYEFLSSHVAGKLAGVTIRHTNRRSSDADYLLYVLLKVKDRVLVAPNILYRYEQGRGDKLLNGRVRDMVKNVKNPEMLSSFNGLIEKHNQFIEGIRKGKK